MAPRNFRTTRPPLADRKNRQNNYHWITDDLFSIAVVKPDIRHWTPQWLYLVCFRRGTRVRPYLGWHAGKKQAPNFHWSPILCTFKVCSDFTATCYATLILDVVKFLQKLQHCKRFFGMELEKQFRIECRSFKKMNSPAGISTQNPLYSLQVL